MVADLGTLVRQQGDPIPRPDGRTDGRRIGFRHEPSWPVAACSSRMRACPLAPHIACRGATVAGSGAWLATGASPAAPARIAETRHGRRHHLAERFAGIHLVVAEAMQRHQFLRLAGARVHRLALLRRHEPVVVAGDEQHRSRCDPVHHPFGVEAQCVVNELQRDLAHCARVAAPLCSREFCRLTVGQQDAGALDEFRLALGRAPDPVGGRPFEQIEILVGPSHAAHPASTVAHADHRDHALHPRIDRRDPHHGRSAIAGAVDAQPFRIHRLLRGEPGQCRLRVGDAAVRCKATLGPSLSPQPL